MLSFVTNNINSVNFVNKKNFIKVRLIHFRLGLLNFTKGRHIMGGNFAIGNYYDPYFMQAYQSMNANAVSFKGGQNATGTSQTGAVQNNASASIMPEVKPQYTEEKKGMSTAGKILTGVVAVGAAVCIAGAVKSGSVKPTKIWEGIKSIFNGAKEKIFPTDLPRIIRNEGGVVTCNIPGKTNVMSSKIGNVAAEAQKVGLQVGDIPKLTADAIKNNELAYTWFEFAAGKGNKDSYRVVGDKILKQVNGKWKLQEKVAPSVMKQIEQIKNGVTTDKVTKAFFKHGSAAKVGDNAIRHFKFENGAEALYTLKTKAFAPESEAVKRFCLDNPEFAKALEAIKKNKPAEGFRRLGGVYEFSDGAKVTIENGEIKEFYNASGKKRGLDTDEFVLYKDKNKKVFEKLANPKNLDGFVSTTWTF